MVNSLPTRKSGGKILFCLSLWASSNSLFSNLKMTILVSGSSEAKDLVLKEIYEIKRLANKNPRQGNSTKNGDTPKA